MRILFSVFYLIYTLPYPKIHLTHPYSLNFVSLKQIKLIKNNFCCPNIPRYMVFLGSMADSPRVTFLEQNIFSSRFLTMANSSMAGSGISFPIPMLESYTLYTLVTAMIPEHWELGYSIYVPFRPKHSTVSYFYILPSLWVFMLSHHLLQIEASQMRLE